MYTLTGSICTPLYLALTAWITCSRENVSRRYTCHRVSACLLVAPEILESLYPQELALLSAFF